ncbi:MAG: tolB protein precursor protein [Deltaproteobacteria bacterium]|nr:MAG: tolB protein precursor protein [Deltaproteobacteria bacterium]
MAIVGALWWTGAQAQVFVVPRRPNKSQVRHFRFQWRYIDILVGPEAKTEAADAVDPEAALQEALGGKAKKRDSDEVQPKGSTGASPEPDSQGGTAGSPAPSDAAASPPEAPGPSNPAAGGPERDEQDEQDAPPAEGAGPTSTGPAPRSAPFQDTAAPLPQVAGADGDGLVEPALVPGGHVDGEWAHSLGERSGGVRLYFYAREEKVAERAAGFIERAYRYLVEVFDYVPTETFPYILYNSYTEFLQTNLFPLQEGVLGVTSPRDLKLTLPYFGDHRLFEEVGTHEMVHQFTIQKIRTISEQAKLWGDPLEAMPLWFVEGIAEYYAKRGVDPEAEMLVRDIVVNPDYREGYVMLDFFEDRPFSVLWTYKVGQVRAAFLEDVYGKGTLQRIIERSPLLIGSYEGERQVGGGFPALLEKVTGDSPEVISGKFEQWLKRRAYRTYLDAEQDRPAVEPLPKMRGIVNALAASPSGDLLLYRSIDTETGQSRLFLADRRAPEYDVRVAQDGVPGIESLHPVADVNFDLSDDALVFVAQADGRDVLYWQAIEHQVEEVDPSDERARANAEEDGKKWRVTVGLGRRIRFDVGRRGLLAVDSPAFSPKGDRVAFIGLDEEGQKDVYLLEPRGGNEFTLERLTQDPWAERALAWGPGGIVFSSDATADGHYNLFRIDPDGTTQTPERLTSEARDEQDPEVLPDGRIFFVAYDGPRADLYEWTEGGVVRRTDISTGLFDVSPGPDGDLWALFHYAGRKRIVRVPKAKLLTLEAPPASSPAEPRRLPRRPLRGAVAYDAFTPRNWELGTLFGFFGAGGSGVFGQLIASASDRLRNHVLVTNLYVLGSFDLTDGYAVYVNQEGRLTWGSGLFQSLLFRIDKTFPPAAGQFTSIERFFGALGSVRYPLDTYRYLQADLQLGGVGYSLSPETRLYLASPNRNLAGRSLLEYWEAENAGLRLQIEGSAKFGYDTIRYHRATGPLAGSSLLLELTAGTQPFEAEVFGSARLDAESYFPLLGRTNFFVRGGAGTAFGGRFSRQFYLSSFDTLRGVPFGDTDFLLGDHFFYATAELQFPLNAIIRLVLFTDIEGVLAIDFGGVGDDLEMLWEKRVLDLVLGVNFGFGPLVFRLHFAKPIATGADPRRFGTRTALPNDGDWVTNFSLGWIYF